MSFHSKVVDFPIIYLSFGHDIIMFCNDSFNYIKNLKEFMNNFEEISRLTFNINKICFDVSYFLTLGELIKLLTLLGLKINTFILITLEHL